jgi:hypothetical protein
MEDVEVDVNLMLSSIDEGREQVREFVKESRGQKNWNRKHERHA